MTRAARATHATVAAVLLAALVVGVPAALVVAVGWPLPTTLVPWSTITATLRGGAVPDAFVVKTLACIVWAAWAELVAAIGWEAAVNVPAVSLGRPGRRAPRIINRHLGGAATKLVGAVVVISISTRASAAAGALPPATPAVATAPLPAADRAPAHPRPAAPAPAVVRASGSPRWVVHPGDTLWGICERATGSPDRLGEVLRLNADQISRPRDVRSGMVLRLPSGAEVPADRRPAILDTTDPAGDTVPPADPGPVRLIAASTPAPGDTEHTVEPGENLWTISAAELRTQADPVPANGEIAPYWEQVIATNRPAIPNPNLIYPGEQVTLPATAHPDAPAPDAPALAATPPSAPAPQATHTPQEPAPPTTTPQAPAAPPTAPMTETPTTPPATPTAAPAPAEGERHTGPDQRWGAPAGLAAATLLATWAAVEARRRRSYRLRRAKAGSVLPPSDPTVGPTAVAVAATADPDTADRLELALRHLAAIDRAVVLPRPQVILRHRNGELEAYLAEPAPEPVGPWTARAGGRIWALDPSVSIPADPDVPSPCPALVELGACEDGSRLYADLEALGATGLAGPPETARQLARALTATLVVSPAARQCRILTWGFDPYGLDGQAPTRLVAAATPDAVLAEAKGTAGPVAAALDDTPGVASTFRLRAAQPEEGWEPAIVIAAGGALSPSEATSLTGLAGGGGRGAAVVVPGDDTPFTLCADPAPGWWRLDPLGLRVRAVGLAESELRDLAGYLADADVAPVAVSVEPPRPDPTVALGDPPASGPLPAGPDAEAAAQREWRVMVRLIGMVDIVNRDGRPAAGERDQPLELLAWLVTHRDTATRTGAVDALWGGRRVDPRTFTNVVSAARNLLRSLAGEPPGGGEWIPARRERIVLHPAVVSDYDLLLDRLARSRHLDPQRAAAVLAGGADLLRGAPLSGVEWLWADEQSLRSRIAVQAVELAAELARLRLASGDLVGAAHAGDLGHAVIPFHDECTVLAIQALAAAGDRAQAIARYEDYERQAMARGEGVAPEVARARNDLLHNPRS